VKHIEKESLTFRFNRKDTTWLFVKHQPRRGKGGAGRSATEPQQATPTKRISPPKRSSRAATHEFAARPRPRPRELSRRRTSSLPPGRLESVRRRDGPDPAPWRRASGGGSRIRSSPPPSACRTPPTGTASARPAFSLICLLPGAGVPR
jgi:hypothetical protein